MIVYFSASTRNIKNDIDLYRKIINAVRMMGHSLHNDWVETAWLCEERIAKTGGKRDWDMAAIVEVSDKSIDAAEVVVAEATDSSTLGVGYEIALAIQRKKPVLALVRDDKTADSYVTGINNELLTIKKYNDDNLQKIIRDFLEANTIGTKDLRFNFVIDRQIYNYLRLKSFKSGKTKAEVVRDLLLEDIDRDAKI